MLEEGPQRPSGFGNIQTEQVPDTVIEVVPAFREGWDWMTSRGPFQSEALLTARTSNAPSW